MSSPQPENEIIRLDYENELQLIVRGPNDKVWLTLLEGSAEIFGSDLLLNQVYEFSYFSSVAVFTWTGCIINLQKEASKNTYFHITASKIPKMKNLHEQIEEIRFTSEATNDFPIILVTGHTDVGKSTICRFLLNYAVKSGRKPTFVDLDIGQSSLSITGTVGLLPVQEQSDIKGRFNEQELSVYYFGYISPGHNMFLYELLLQKVGESLQIRARRSDTKSSGAIVDTCGWTDGAGYKLIKKIIKILKVNMVLVISEKPLYYKLMQDVSKETKVIFVKKITDASTRNKKVRKDSRNNCVHQYFYGSYGQLKPYTIKINFKELQIYKSDFSRSSNVVSVIIDPSVLYQVLALSYADNIENILLTSIYGFICIVELDMDTEIATVLSPQPGPLPSNRLIMGDIKLATKEECSSLYSET